MKSSVESGHDIPGGIVEPVKRDIFLILLLYHEPSFCNSCTESELSLKSGGFFLHAYSCTF